MDVPEAGGDETRYSLRQYIFRTESAEGTENFSNDEVRMTNRIQIESCSFTNAFGSRNKPFDNIHCDVDRVACPN